MNWIQRAKEVFGDRAMITANGRFAAALAQDGTVTAAYLFADEDSARRAALGWNNCKVIDLKPRNCPLPRKKLKDDWEDRQWEKRQSNA